MSSNVRVRVNLVVKLQFPSITLSSIKPTVSLSSKGELVVIVESLTSVMYDSFSLNVIFVELLKLLPIINMGAAIGFLFGNTFTIRRSLVQITVSFPSSESSHWNRNTISSRYDELNNFRNVS